MGNSGNLAAIWAQHSGTALILSLFFSMLISLLAIVALESGILHHIIHRCFSDDNHLFIQAETYLLELESCLHKASAPYLSKAPVYTKIEWLQFVTDTLNFDDNTGLDYYQCHVKAVTDTNSDVSIQSSYAKRRV